jgi:hypothetical protein
VAEWSKAHAWKVCRGPKLLEGSNPSRSASRMADETRRPGAEAFPRAGPLG